MAWPATSLARLTQSEPLARVLRLLAAAPSHAALVVESDTVVGTLSARDVERVLRAPAAWARRDAPPVVHAGS